jgi:hypothetical protein
VQRIVGVLFGICLFIPLAHYQTDLIDRLSSALDTASAPTDEVKAPVPQLARLVNELRAVTSK